MLCFNQLECLLNLPEVWDSFNSPIINTDSTLLCDICDGSYIRNHPLQKKGGINICNSIEYIYNEHALNMYTFRSTEWDNNLLLNL